MKSKLQLDGVIILRRDAGFETFLESLSDFHDPSKPRGKEKLPVAVLRSSMDGPGESYAASETRPFDWNNSILQNV